MQVCECTHVFGEVCVCVCEFDYSLRLVASTILSEMTEVLHSVEKCPCKSILVNFLGEEESRCFLHTTK